MKRFLLVSALAMALVALVSGCTSIPVIGPAPAGILGVDAPLAAVNQAAFTLPPYSTSLPTGLPAAQKLGNYVALVWNNLGMHCFQNEYSQFMILPPYNIFVGQVIARGHEPSIVKSGIKASYQVLQLTNPVPWTNFWTYASAYGFQLQPGIGLTGKGLSGSMDPAGDRFIAEGVPVMDRQDNGTWDPYPMFVATVSGSSGQQLVQTANVAPASTEMDCYLCHGGNSMKEVMTNILSAHDRLSKTGLVAQAAAGKPVFCASCHADPAMGVMTSNGAKAPLSTAMHSFHASKMNVNAAQLPANRCEACHPGPVTHCTRDVMTKAGIVCVDCHGSMADVGSSSRTPWVSLPRCQGCHGENLRGDPLKRIANPNAAAATTSAALYQNGKAHGGGGIYCPACHGSPHAVYPTSVARDNWQSTHVQGSAGTIKECSVCHTESPEGDFWHFRSGS